MASDGPGRTTLNPSRKVRCELNAQKFFSRVRHALCWRRCGVR